MLTESRDVQLLTLRLLEAAYLSGGLDWDANLSARLDAFAQAGAVVTHEWNVQGIQVAIVRVHGIVVLVIPGSNERLDWKANLTAVPFPWNGRFWHQGFLRGAVDLLDALPRGVHLVTGHSYGAAIAQIVGAQLALPTLTWAAPKVLWLSRQPVGAKFIRNIVAADDGIRFVPPGWLGYAWVGETEWLRPLRRRIGEDHRIKHYLEFFQENPP